jgi:chaperone required for assembly of F1-ATPase
MSTMTESELVQHLTREWAVLRDRVANLELALHGMWALMQHLQPPETQQAVSAMLQEHYDCMASMGGGQIGGGFKRA